MAYWTRAVFSSTLVAFLVAFAVHFFDAHEIMVAGITCDDANGRLRDCTDSELIDQYGIGRILLDPQFWHRVAISGSALAIICFSACALTQWRRKVP